MPQSHWKLTADERQALEAFLRTLVQTPSLPGDEGQVAALVMDEMRRLGYDDVQMDAAGNGLMFDSHMDTVSVSDRDAWTVDPWGAEVRNGRLYGLGACDMKGGLAATVYGAAALRQRGPDLKGPVWVICVGLEEPSEGTCTRILFEEDQMDAQWVVIAEPSNLNVVRAQRGHVEMKLNIKGKSAHSSAPQLGVNAIYAAARIIFGLEMLA
ncbi:MAG: M20/M25/M40 family metallo-hydrolase, partial [Chloroflexi bacterium]|nr:M20/M25/M40 family metallo-hydrolase [Chloroflexota bacterium]